MANFPTSLPGLSTSLSAAATLAAAGHTSHHNTMADEVNAIAAKVGINSSATTTTHDYKLSGVTGTDKAVSLAGTESLSNKTISDTLSMTTGAITQSGAAAHITLTPGASKLVKIAVLQQNDTSNAYTNNCVILTGWGYKQGAASPVRYQAETVTFGVTFSARPIGVAVIAGTKNGSNPTHQGDLSTGDVAINCNVDSIGTTTFDAVVAMCDSGETLANADRAIYMWEVVGPI